MTNFGQGMMIVLSSPSGAGKTTLTRMLSEKNDNFIISISHTTRTPRHNEVNGKDYFFVDKKEFKTKPNLKGKTGWTGYIVCEDDADWNPFFGNGLWDDAETFTDSNEFTHLFTLIILLYKLIMYPNIPKFSTLSDKVALNNNFLQFKSCFRIPITVVNKFGILGHNFIFFMHSFFIKSNRFNSSMRNH